MACSDPPRGAKARRPAGPAPTRARLHEAALAHLARFSTTASNLVRVLDRRVQRWARAAADEGRAADADLVQAYADVREVVAGLVAAGMVDDAAFAVARAGRLVRGGRSRRAVAAHLVAKGVTASVAEAALPDATAELAAAARFVQRRRIGPFREAAEPGDGDRLNELAMLARAGFGRDVAERVLSMDAVTLADLIADLRRV